MGASPLWGRVGTRPHLNMADKNTQFKDLHRRAVSTKQPALIQSRASRVASFVMSSGETGEKLDVEL